MLELSPHILEQFNWNEVKEALYVAGPMLAVMAGMLTGLINPWLGAGVGMMVDAAFQRITFSTLGDLGEIATGIPEIGMAGQGLDIYKSMGEMFYRAMEVGLSKQMESFPELNSFPLPEAWRPPVYNKWPFPDSGDAVPTTLPKTEPDIFKNVPWIPDLDQSFPNWRNMSVEEIAKIFWVGVDELLSTLGLSSILGNIFGKIF